MNKVSKVLIASLAVLFMAGCTVTPKTKKVEVVDVANDKLQLNIPNPAPLELREFDWIIITEENAEQIWELLKKENEGVALFALRHGDYKNLSLNIKDIRSQIGEYVFILKKYREYYEGDK